jgi:transcriptional antiterminator
MPVKCLSRLQKSNLCYYYANKTHTPKQLAELYQVSYRTVVRVLEENGYAKPKDRDLEEAKAVLRLMQKHNIGYHKVMDLIRRSITNPIPNTNQIELKLG